MKHVAMVVHSEIISKAYNQVLGLFKPMDVRVYTSVRELISEILNDKVLGILAIYTPDQDGWNIDGTIRHDLKYFDGFDEQKVKDFQLPKCESLSAIEPLSKLLHSIMNLKNEIMAKDLPPKEAFDLNSIMPELQSAMLIPQREIKVCIVDDKEEVIEQMALILRQWSNVRLQIVLAEANSKAEEKVRKDVEDLAEQIAALNPDILILDEIMGYMKGTDVYSTLKSNFAFQAIVVSSSGGECPEFASLHFDGKSYIKESGKEARRFVKFLNRIMETI